MKALMMTFQIAFIQNNLSRVVRKPEGKREADQRLCFRYIDSTIPLLSKYEISSL